MGSGGNERVSKTINGTGNRRYTQDFVIPGCGEGCYWTVGRHQKWIAVVHIYVVPALMSIKGANNSRRKTGDDGRIVARAGEKATVFLSPRISAIVDPVGIAFGPMATQTAGRFDQIERADLPKISRYIASVA